MVKRKREEDSQQLTRPKRGKFELEGVKENLTQNGQLTENYFDPLDFEDDGWSHTAGTIEYVKGKNFMCHEILNYAPTYELNFLHGVIER